MVHVHMRLVAVARAKLEKESVADGLVCQAQDLTLHIGAKSNRVRAGTRDAKAG
jgi:hypothetical protein